LLAENPKGLTIEEVARRLSLNRATAAKYLNAMAVSGQAEVRALGPAKLFSASHRLPLADLMSLSSDLILILDDGLFVLNANDTLLYHLGLEASAVKGQRLDLSPLAPFLADLDPELLLQTLEGDEQIFECTIERGGRVRYYRGRALPLVFESGGRGVGLIFEDVTGDRRHQQELEVRVRERTRELEEANAALEREVEEHRRTESRLAASRRTVQQILETTPNLVYVYAVGTGRLQYASPNLASILGYPSEEARAGDGAEIPPHVHPDDRTLLARHLESLSESGDGEVCEIELRVRHAFGHHVILRCRELVFKRDGSGHPRLVIGTAEDVTERKRAANALRTANRQLLLLNGITRHDILNQLNVLSGSLELARGEMGGACDAAHLEMADRAVETIRRQITFTRDYQNIGARPPVWQRVRDVIDLVSTQLEHGGTAIEASACDIEVYADGLFEKAVYALIDNALRHGGEIGMVRFSCVPRDGSLVIVCEDDGVGIAAEEKERIFERAYGRNSGYGLFLAREILGITGLSLRETGLAGGGARFEISVPHGLFRLAPP
jgi:PAS domain S-box-containing protein